MPGFFGAYGKKKMVEEYRRRAVEVEQLAKEAISEDHQQRILGIALSWRELADQREWLLMKRYGVPRSSKLYAALQ